MKQKMSFWQIVVYVSWSIIALWLVLKSTGVIKTPFWLEYGVPVGSFLIGMLGIYHNLIDNDTKLAVALATLSVKVSHLETDVEYLTRK